MWPFLWNILEFTIDLKTIGKGLSKQKNMFNFKGVENIVLTNVLCMKKNSKDIMKWLQIHGIPTSWVNKHNS
jgi:hypothetical protein